MIKAVLIEILGPVVAAACALLAACAPPPVPVQPVPPGPTPAELANYAVAQTQYRKGLATANDDAVAAANKAFLGISQAILARQDPRLFEAEVVCERYRVAPPAATSPHMPAGFEAQCQSIGRRFNEATSAIRGDMQRRIAAADFATIAQAGPAHP